MGGPSRLKKLDLNDQIRQRILNNVEGDGRVAEAEPQQPMRQRPVRAGQNLPYERVQRILNHGNSNGGQQEAEASPLKNVLGMLSDKIQSVMKSIFPVRLFAPVPETVPEPEEVPVEVRKDDEKEARRAAFSELSNFFGSHRGALSSGELAKVVQIVNSTAPTTLIPPETALFRTSRPTLMTPVARKSTTSSPPPASVQRICPPSTQLKFRTKHVEAPITSLSLPVHDDRLDVAEGKKPLVEPVAEEAPASPMKIEPELKLKSPPKKRNKFVGQFYLDPDEEEAELLELEKKEKEREERIRMLAMRKEQRERKVAFRAEPEKVEPVKEEPKALLFDFGAVQPDQAVKPEEKPLISLGTPVKKVELPSATTKISAEPKRKRSVDDETKASPFAFKPMATTEAPKFDFGAPKGEEKPKAESDKTDKPAFTGFVFGAPQTDEQKSVAEDAKLLLSFGAPKQENPPAFSFGTGESSNSDAKPFTFSAPSEVKKEPETAKPFTFGAPKAEETRPITFSFPTAEQGKPITFGAPKTEEVKPFTFPAPKSEDAKPILFGDAQPFNFAKPVEEEKKTEEIKFNFTPPTTTTAAAADSKPISFGTAPAQPTGFSFALPTSTVDKPAATSTSFSFGSTEKKTEEAKPALFSFGSNGAASTATPFNFTGNSAGTESKPSTTAAPAFNFTGNSVGTESKPFSFPVVSPVTFGTQASSATETKPFSFGNFGATNISSNTADDMMEESTPPLAAPTTAFSFGSSSTAFGFGTVPSPAPSSGSTPFNFAPPAAPTTTSPAFSFGSTSPSPSFGAFNQQPAQPAAQSPFSFGQPQQQQQPQPAFDAIASMDMSNGNAGFNMGAAPAGQNRPVSKPVSRLGRRR